MTRSGLIRTVLGLAALTVCVVFSEPPKRQVARGASGVVALNTQLLWVVWAGFRPFAADFYWVKTAEQIGAANTADEYRDVGVWANAAVDLDPRFKIVYSFGAVAMPYNLGRNTWVNGDESTALLRKGLAVFPNDLKFKFLLAHNLIFYHHRFSEAGAVLREISMEPNAPPFLAQLATRVMAQGGEIDSAIEFAKSGMATASDDETRETFARRITQLETERLLQQVDAAVARFRETEGRQPTGIAEMLTKGALAELPVDPSGGEVYLDKKGRARSTAEARRLEVSSSEQKQLDLEEEKAHSDQSSP